MNASQCATLRARCQGPFAILSAYSKTIHYFLRYILRDKYFVGVSNIPFGISSAVNDEMTRQRSKLGHRCLDICYTIIANGLDLLFTVKIAYTHT